MTNGRSSHPHLRRRGLIAGAAGLAATLMVGGDPAGAAGGGRGGRHGGDGDGGHRQDGKGRGGRRTHEFRGMWLATVTNRDWPSRPGLPARHAA